MEISLDIKDLKEASIHFGHPKHQSHPKMKKNIYTLRNGIYIIDFQCILTAINNACKFIEEYIQNNDGDLLYVGTKKVAQNIIYEQATRASAPYVTHRWVGGTLTNFINIRRGMEKLEELRSLEERGILNLLSKKEATYLAKKRRKLEALYSGIEKLETLPAILYIVDIVKEKSAVDEANRMGIPIIAMVDTNANPELVSYPIPSNDDSEKAIRLVTTIITDAYIEAKKKREEREGQIYSQVPKRPVASTNILRGIEGLEDEVSEEELEPFFKEDEG